MSNQPGTTSQLKSSLRRQLRQQRRSLSDAQQQSAARSLVTTLKPIINASKTPRIAIYWAMDGEISLNPLMAFCAQQGIEVFLPVLHPFKPKLWFASYSPNDMLMNNQFGIPEPEAKTRLQPWQLSAVLLPLVGFDEQGARIGMGGGFYDRTFAMASSWPHRPKLIGVAHECQKLAAVPIEPWDIPLNGIVTDKKYYRAK